jgi:hypothetical protein
MALDLGEIEFYAPMAGGVALHGLADCLHPMRMLCYAPALIPVEGNQLSAGFVVASLLHLSMDASALVSIIIHALIGMFLFLEAREGATAILLGYMWVVHMPLVLWRAITSQSNMTALVTALSIAVGTYGGTPLLTRLNMIKHDKEQKSIRLVIPPMAQRVVICHVAANLLMA